MRTLINYDAFSILLVDTENRCLRHRFSERYDQRVDLDNIPLGKGITGAAAQQREIIRVDDILTDPRYIASHPDIRSEVAVPLIVSDRVIGVMDLESERIALLHGGARADTDAAGAADRQLHRKCAAVRRTGASASSGWSRI